MLNSASPSSSQGSRLVAAHLVVPPLVRHLVHNQLLQVLLEFAVVIAADQAQTGKLHATESQWRFDDRHLAIGIGAELVAVDLQCRDGLVSAV